MKWLYLYSLLTSIILNLSLVFIHYLAPSHKESKPSQFQVRYVGVAKGQKKLNLVAHGEQKSLNKLSDLAIDKSPQEQSFNDQISQKKAAIKKEKPSPQLRKKVGSFDFQNSDITVDVDLPEGVELDDLNEEELKFYSFHQRTLLQYYGTFVQKLRDFEVEKPHLHFPMTKKRQVLRGRITFDREGNIQRIKMLNWSEQEELQDFFISMLKRLEKVPNPPEMLIKNRNQFSITYGLIIQNAH